jgi:dephospho-CoA kinase
VLIGVTGLSGAGKSTCADYLVEHLPGSKVYVGEAVQDEVRLRGLQVTADTEKAVRAAVRAEEGSDAFARRSLPKIRELLQNGCALIDAVYVQSEWELYGSTFNDLAVLIHVHACQAIRIERLANRRERPLSADELIERDAFEFENLKLADVFAMADHRLTNEADCQDLYRQLDAFIPRWRKISH